jgi:hypothetical protein
MHFRTWCRENDISPISAYVQYASSPFVIYGLNGNDVEFIYYETWMEHPQAKEIDQAVRVVKMTATTREITMEPNTSFWYRLTKLDPAVYRGLIVSGVALLASIGVAISPGVPDALIAFIVVVVPLVQALWTRPAVTANARVAVYVPDPVSNPQIVEAGEATTTATNAQIIEAAKEQPRG